MTKILRVNEFCSPQNYHTSTNLPQLDCRVLINENEQTQLGIIVLPQSVQATKENAIKIHTILRDCIDDLGINTKYGYSIGQMFSGEYCIGDCTYDNTSLCVEGCGQLGGDEVLTKLAELILAKFNLNRALLISENSKSELMLERNRRIQKTQING